MKVRSTTHRGDGSKAKAAKLLGKKPSENTRGKSKKVIQALEADVEYRVQHETHLGIPSRRS